MAGEFGAFVNQKRKGRGAGGSDVLLRDLAEAIGISVSYLSDILKGRRSLPDMKQLDAIAKILSLSPDEKEECWTWSVESVVKRPLIYQATLWC